MILLICSMNIDFIAARSHEKNEQSRSIDNRGIIDSIKKLLGIDGTTTTDKECIPGWIGGPNGACYFVPRHPDVERGTFFQAATKCSLEALDEADHVDAHVLSIETEEEQVFIESLLSEHPETDFWTNGNRLNSADMKIWHWGSSLASIEDQGFANWDEGQPQWKNYIDDEECIFLGHESSFHFKWHDHRCSYNWASYVCEYSRNEPEPQPEPEPEPQPEPEPEPESEPEPEPQPKPKPEPTPEANKACAAEWILGVNGACYMVPNNPDHNRGTFFDAKAACSKIHPGSHVVGIESAAEQKFIESLLSKYPETDFWTSGNRLNPEDRKIWHWGNNPASIEDQVFVNWDEGQPQWKNFIDDEECIFLGHKSLFNFKWHDHRCSYDSASYVCEYIPDKPEPEPKPEDDEDESEMFGSGGYQDYNYGYQS